MDRIPFSIYCQTINCHMSSKTKRNDNDDPILDDDYEDAVDVVVSADGDEEEDVSSPRRCRLQRMCSPDFNSPTNNSGSSRSTKTKTSSLTNTAASTVVSRCTADDGPLEDDVILAEDRARDNPDNDDFAREATLLTIAFEKSLFTTKTRTVIRATSELWKKDIFREIALNDRGKYMLEKKKGKN